MNICKCCGKPKRPDFSGHRYGLQALKPSIEFIALAQVPYSGKPVQSIAQTGAGALWIDGGRVGSDDDRVHGGNQGSLPQPMSWGTPTGQKRPTGKRWPANFAICHSEQCVRVGERQVKPQWGQATERTTSDSSQSCYHPRRKEDKAIGYTDATGHETVPAWDCAPGCVVAALDGQAGERGSNDKQTRVGRPVLSTFRQKISTARTTAYDDTGGPSRFFHVSSWSLDVAERLSQADPVYYCSKSSTRERSTGLPAGQRNTNPCVKPLQLLIWLSRLLAPPSAYAPRRLLIPFAGSGSEACAAVISEQWESVTAIEQDQSYVDIARHRVAYWQHRGKL